MNDEEKALENIPPVREEMTTGPLEVTGSIPEHLDGRYLRIGPNPVIDVDPNKSHWFLGDGMVHGARLRDGRAEWYRNRYVRSPGLARQLGETPPERQRRKGPDGSPNTHVIVQGGRTLALVDSGPPPYELTEELGTAGACDFDGTLPAAYIWNPKHQARIGVLPREGEASDIRWFEVEP